MPVLYLHQHLKISFDPPMLWNPRLGFIFETNNLYMSLLALILIIGSEQKILLYNTVENAAATIIM